MAGEIDLHLRRKEPLFTIIRWNGWGDSRHLSVRVRPEPEPFSEYQSLLQLIANLFTRWKHRLYSGEGGGFEVAGFEVKNAKDGLDSYGVPVYGLETCWHSHEKPSNEAYEKLAGPIETWISTMEVFSYHQWAQCPLESLRQYMANVFVDDLGVSADLLTIFGRARPDEALVGNGHRYWL